MVGTHRILVYSKQVRYDFSIRRNITVISGDSATGKTTLISMIKDFNQYGVANIKVECDKECIVIEGKDWERQLESVCDSIVFVDEGNEFIRSNDFASYIKNSDNYYVLITRYHLSNLPYSVNEIYSFRNSGKYKGTKQTYNELYNLYGKYNTIQEIKPDKVITEDSNSGYEFFKEIVGADNCESANGKDNIPQLIKKDSDDKILIIADGAAFGSLMEKTIRCIQYYSGYSLYLPESFEWIILKSGVISFGGLKDILENTSNYVESKDYFSWERFFTQTLVDATKGTAWTYSKSSINKAYLSSISINKIVKVMKNILLDTNKQSV